MANGIGLYSVQGYVLCAFIFRAGASLHTSKSNCVPSFYGSVVVAKQAGGAKMFFGGLWCSLLFADVL